MSERYRVYGTTGYSEHPHPRQSRQRTTYFVADTWYCYREMPLFRPRFDRPYPWRRMPLHHTITGTRALADFTAAYYNATDAS